MRMDHKTCPPHTVRSAAPTATHSLANILDQIIFFFIRQLDGVSVCHSREQSTERELKKRILFSFVFDAHIPRQQHRYYTDLIYFVYYLYSCGL